MKITVIGAGNGGQAIAAYSAMQGFYVCLFNHSLDKIKNIAKKKKIRLTGKLKGIGNLSIVTDNIKIAVEFADVLMIVTTANAHKEIAIQIVSYLKENQIIILNPGRTGGALEFGSILNDLKIKKNIFLGEVQTLMYACRLLHEGLVNIIGIKEKVLLAARNVSETNYIIDHLSHLYTCFSPANNLLHTSLENIGSIFHPCIVLFNAAAIERNNSFYFYREMTPQVAHFINKVDEERLNIGKAFGIDLMSAEDWISSAYKGVHGDNLQQRMKNNPAYYNIKAPSSIYTRQLMEDIPMGLVPMAELGKIANTNVELMDSIITICSTMLMIDFRKTGRTLASLGFNNMSVQEILAIT
jgi:opine dehydrogenase